MASEARELSLSCQQGEEQRSRAHQHRRDSFTLENNVHTRRPLKLVTAQLKAWWDWIIHGGKDLYLTACLHARQAVNRRSSRHLRTYLLPDTGVSVGSLNGQRVTKRLDLPCPLRDTIKHGRHIPHKRGAGIAQWLEHRTSDWKVAGSNPCWNGGRIFFSRVDFLCWLLFRYPFHPRVTTVARKKSRSFCQKCRWQVTAKHAYTLRMWLLLNRASALVTTCP